MRDPALTIGLLPWGDTWEDFFDTINVSLENFCNEVTGGWQFGIINALKAFGIETVIFYATNKVEKTTHFIHKPTGATVCMIPTPQTYRSVRKRMTHPYPSLAYWLDLESLFGKVKPSRRFIYEWLKQISPYLSLPLLRFAAEIRHHGCKAILCQEYEYSHFDICILVGSLLRLPVFANFQGGTYDWNRIGRYIRPFMMKRCDGFAIGSKKEIDRVRSEYSIDIQRLVRIFNPVDLAMWDTPVDHIEARSFFGLPLTAQIVLWHGRVDIHNKGLDILFESWLQVCGERPDRELWLFLLGGAEDNEKLRARICELPLKNVKWIEGYTNDRELMRRFLATGDVFAFPSRWEGFPVVPLEAMACGLPVVAADASGIADIFEGGENSGGIVVPREDSVALAQGIGRLLDDDDLRHRMGKLARERIETSFTLGLVGEQLKNFLSVSRESDETSR